MSAPTRNLTVNGRSLQTADSHGLQRDAVGSWGVFAQGLAAAKRGVKKDYWRGCTRLLGEFANKNTFEYSFRGQSQRG